VGKLDRTRRRRPRWGTALSAVEKLDCEDDDAVGDGILLVLVPVEADGGLSGAKPGGRLGGPELR